jgi:hypothetical protein
MGLYAEGEVRDAVVIPFRGTKRIMVARNNDKVLVFQKHEKSP